MLSKLQHDHLLFALHPVLYQCYTQSQCSQCMLGVFVQMSVASTVNALNVKHLLAHLRPVSPPAAVCAGQRCLG